MTEYRVEELATAAGISVDTLRFYQHRGLLDPPERRGRVGYYDDAHVQRLARIKELQAQGLSLSIIARLLDDLHPADAALVAAVAAGSASERTLSLEELSEETGVPNELLASLVAEGLLSPSDPETDRPYTAGDVRAVRAGLALLESGIPLGSLLELARTYTTAIDRVAEEAVALFDTYVRKPAREGGATDAGEQEVVTAFEELLPAAGTLVRHQFEQAVLRAARERIDGSSIDST